MIKAICSKCGNVIIRTIGQNKWKIEGEPKNQQDINCKHNPKNKRYDQDPINNIPSFNGHTPGCICPHCIEARKFLKILIGTKKNGKINLHLASIYKPALNIPLTTDIIITVPEVTEPLKLLIKNGVLIQE